MSRQPLDLGRLDQFTPRPRDGHDTGRDRTGGDAPARQSLKAGLDGMLAGDAPATPTGGDEFAGFPSREPVEEAQLNIKLPRAEAARFRRLAKADRYTRGAFLTLLMDGYEGRG